MSSKNDVLKNDVLKNDVLKNDVVKQCHQKKQTAPIIACVGHSLTCLTTRLVRVLANTSEVCVKRMSQRTQTLDSNKTAAPLNPSRDSL
jgi:hypothetical protein